MTVGTVFGLDAKAVLAALDLSQAIIEFDTDGRILRANANFCRTIGYEAHEIVGQHHRMFVDPTEVASADYAAFWKALGAGKFQQKQYRRIGKGGKEVWIEASYNPVMRGAKPYKVVKFATDITEAMARNLDYQGKISALSRAQAMIEFAPNGNIIDANENFLTTLGYSIDDIRGKHHAIFCETEYVQSTEYAEFWKQLGSGQFVTDQFKRIAKDGTPVFIQASYNPIIDDRGRVVKIVKFATDVTERVKAVEELGAGLDRLSHCNIRITLDRPLVGEFENLRKDFNTSIGEFQRTLSSVLQETKTLNTNGQEMRDAAESLAERTSQQALAIEQTSTALEQVTVTVRESTERTRDTRNLVAGAKASAGASVEIVGQTVLAMQRIEQASNEITQIINVIDEIAFQTNLLALNAGVEAARAGDAGKGFAVVAQEVRELAQRAASAAKDIKGLITKSGQQVVQGVRLVGETGKALHEIDSIVEKINENMEAMATAASEQSNGLTEINSAVNRIDAMTQQNAEMVCRTTMVSRTLADGAAKLAELVGRFQLNRRTAIRDAGPAGAEDQRPQARQAA